MSLLTKKAQLTIGKQNMIIFDQSVIHEIHWKIVIYYKDKTFPNIKIYFLKWFVFGFAGCILTSIFGLAASSPPEFTFHAKEQVSSFAELTFDYLR